MCDYQSLGQLGCVCQVILVKLEQLGYFCWVIIAQLGYVGVAGQFVQVSLVQLVRLIILGYINLDMK